MADLSPNFGFLHDGYDPLFHQLALAAERALAYDPNATLIKLRQLAEAFARHLAASDGMRLGPDAKLVDLFHALRREGNRAAHDFVGSRSEAVAALRLARSLALWFHKMVGGVGGATFKAGPFVMPADPGARLRELEEALAKLAAEAAATRTEAAQAHAVAALESARRAEAEAQAARSEDERKAWEALAVGIEADTQAKLAGFEAALTALAEETAQKPDAEKQLAHQVQTSKAIAATGTIELDEAAARLVIDQQLRQSGWEADSRMLRYGLGARPEKGKARAIAEWPTDDGIADYVLFVGLVAVGIVEAKRGTVDVPGRLGQPARYSLAFRDPSGPGAVGWPAQSGVAEGSGKRFRVPFLYATNGRPYLRQLETKSGIWFRDARRPTNLARALTDWHTPDGLMAMLAQDEERAAQLLASEPTEYLGLWPFQLRAVRAIEEAIGRGRREVLVAMATGTGKTRTVIGLMYRLLKSKRFRRVLFLVDRSALGEQAQNAMKEMQLEALQNFSQIYEVKEMRDAAPAPETKVHVATVQGMVKRVLGADDDGPAVPVDAYDLVVVDESHRGYTLDRDMTEGEQELRGFADYVSTYRRVLDHFDAVKVGLTATPALHTREIFGPPVFEYTYRQAVADGTLVDHEPPDRIITRLARHGIHLDRGSQVNVIRPDGAVQLSLLPDDLDFDVEAFNRQVVTEGFNRALAEDLAQDLDPFGPAKTLVFCVNDAHADMFVALLKAALAAKYDGIDDQAVVKITGSVDKPLEAIRRFKNENLPAIVVTVDLLTTGVDVPAITTLVFVRRVRSRILYEQMLGRATRKCDAIGKDVFRVIDAVDMYKTLQPVSSMKPVVTQPDISVSQLVSELCDPRSATITNADGRSHAADVLEQLVERLRRRIRASARRDHGPTFRASVEHAEALAGQSIVWLPDKLQHLGPAGVAAWLAAEPALASVIERLFVNDGVAPGVVIYEGDDEVVARERGYGVDADGAPISRPDDYIEAFGSFVRANLNLIPALAVVVQRPRDLTRAGLKELRLALDLAGSPRLGSGWRGEPGRTRTSPRPSSASSASARWARRSCRTPSASSGRWAGCSPGGRGPGRRRRGSAASASR